MDEGLSSCIVEIMYHLSYHLCFPWYHMTNLQISKVAGINNSELLFLSFQDTTVVTDVVVFESLAQIQLYQ